MFAILAVALIVRMVYLYQIEDLIYFQHLVGDAKAYDTWARELLANRWAWPHPFYQAPLYPYFLAAIYRFLGSDPWTPRIVQCTLAATGCVFVGSAATHWFSRTVGLTAALLLAIYPPAIYFDGIIQKASLGFTLMSALLLTIAHTMRRSTWWVSFLTGLVLALLALTRENALALAPLILGWMIVRRSPTRRARWTAVAMCLAGLTVVLLPVGLHNQRAGGAFSLTTFQLGPNFYMGNHSGADGRYKPMIPGQETPEYERADATRLAEQAVGHPLTPREVSSYWLTQSLAYIRSDPTGWLRLLVTKWSLVWNRYEIPDTESYYIYRDTSPILRTTGRLYHFGLLAPLAVLGIALTWANRRTLALLYLMIFITAASVAAFYVFGRYRFPLVPILAMFAGVGLVETVRQALAKAWSRLLVPVSLATISAIWINWPINPEAELNAGQRGNLGAALAAAGRMDEAIPQFERAAAAYPDAPRLQQFLGDALSITGRHAEAIPHYEAALAREPNRPNVAFNLAWALERTGRPSDAIKYYERAIETNPADQPARDAIRRLRDGS